MLPLRLTRSRQRGARMVSPDGCAIRYCGRPGVFANPFTIAKFGEYWALKHFVSWLLGFGWREFEQARRRELIRRLPELEGCHLACWCPLPEPGERDRCRAAVYLRLLKQPTPLSRLRAEI